MFFFGILAVYFGKELSWDLANYHFYNPYAFIHHREIIDYWPHSFIHQYLNPLLDFLSYFLILFLSPMMAEFVLGAIHGINFFLLFLIIQTFLPSKQLMMVFLIALLGFYGPTSLPGIGSFSNDELVSLFVLAFVYFHLRFLHLYVSIHILQKSWISLSGLLLGLGLGLKLTIAPFVLSAVFALLLLSIPIRKKLICAGFLSLAITIGFLITAGYWLLIQWQQHHNPFFPFLNQIFHSPDFAISNFRDTRFMPKSILEAIFYPFYFSFDGRIGDLPFRDFRFLCIYILLFIWVIYGIKKKIWFRLSTSQLLTSWFFIFFIFSYIIWQTYFSIARYLVPLEMLAPLMIYLLVAELINKEKIQTTIIAVLFYFLFFLMQPIPMVRSHHYDATFFNITLPQTIFKVEKANVLIAYTAYALERDPRPQAYLIPFFPTQWRFIGIPFSKGKVNVNLIDMKKMKNILNNKQPLFLLTTSLNMPELYQLAHVFGYSTNGTCYQITSDRQAVTQQKVLLCPVHH